MITQHALHFAPGDDWVQKLCMWCEQPTQRVSDRQQQVWVAHSAPVSCCGVYYVCACSTAACRLQSAYTCVMQRPIWAAVSRTAALRHCNVRCTSVIVLCLSCPQQLLAGTTLQAERLPCDQQRLSVSADATCILRSAHYVLLSWLKLVCGPCARMIRCW
jgi:hypothetical protein